MLRNGSGGEAADGADCAGLVASGLVASGLVISGGVVEVVSADGTGGVESGED